MTQDRSVPRRRKLLALSSGGGHWVQLLRLRPAFDDCDVAFATVRRSYEGQVDGARFFVVPDCNRGQRFQMIKCAAAVFLLLLRLRPDVVISTGAAPGYFAIRLGKLLGAETIWVDSIANAEELSMSGRLVGAHASLWLTQWQHLAANDRPGYRGSVL